MFTTNKTQPSQDWNANVFNGAWTRQKQTCNIATVQHERERQQKSKQQVEDAQQHVDVDRWGSSFYGNDYLP